MKKVKALFQIIVVIAIFSAIVAYNGRPPANAPALTEIKQFTLTKLTGAKLRSDEIRTPTIFVLWATWCSPCKIELARVQTLIDHGLIPRESVIAVDIAEDPLLVRRVASERGYTFEVTADPDRRFASLYAVNVTPTILLRNSDGTIAWRTSGISPTLEWRVTSFARAKNKI